MPGPSRPPGEKAIKLYKLTTDGKKFTKVWVMKFNSIFYSVCEITMTVKILNI